MSKRHEESIGIQEVALVRKAAEGCRTPRRWREVEKANQDDIYG